MNPGARLLEQFSRWCSGARVSGACAPAASRGQQSWSRRYTKLKNAISSAGRRGALLIALAAGASLCSPRYARAEGEVLNGSRPAILDDVGIDQKLGDTLPQDVVFKDEAGRDVRLGSLFRGRPVILTLVYFKCPMLCTFVLNDLTRTMNAVPLSAGEDFDVITVSFDPREKSDLAAAKKREYLRQYRRPHAEQGWHFLTGDEDSIRALTRAVGFKYKWDPKFEQFVHASGITVLTPDAKISKYFFGIDYAPTDVRLSVLEASDQKVGTFTDTILLFCYHYDPATKRYTLAVTRLVQAAAGLTVAVLGTFLLVNFRRERRRSRQVRAEQAPAPSATGDPVKRE